MQDRFLFSVSPLFSLSTTTPSVRLPSCPPFRPSWITKYKKIHREISMGLKWSNVNIHWRCLTWTGRPDVLRRMCSSSVALVVVPCWLALICGWVCVCVWAPYVVLVQRRWAYWHPRRVLRAQQRELNWHTHTHTQTARRREQEKFAYASDLLYLTYRTVEDVRVYRDHQRKTSGRGEGDVTKPTALAMSQEYSPFISGCQEIPDCRRAWINFTGGLDWDWCLSWNNSQR